MTPKNLLDFLLLFCWHLSTCHGFTFFLWRLPCSLKDSVSKEFLFIFFKMLFSRIHIPFFNRNLKIIALSLDSGFIYSCNFLLFLYKKRCHVNEGCYMTRSNNLAARKLHCSVLLVASWNFIDWLTGCPFSFSLFSFLFPLPSPSLPPSLPPFFLPSSFILGSNIQLIWLSLTC